MPELPELSAHAERLESAYAGAVLERFEPLSFTALKSVAPSPDAALGSPLRRVGRRGKYLLLDFGDVTFVVHLMQAGRLEPDQRRSRRPRGGLARWLFTPPHAPLLLTEAGTERRAGVWAVAGDPAGQPPLDRLGPEADRVGAEEMASLLAAHPARLHTLLRDQAVLAGLGRRLANEVCHRGGFSPFARTSALDAGDVGRLVEAIRACVAEGVAAERGRGDLSRSAQRPARVHGRTGQPCPVCGDTVRAVEYRDYTVNYCPACQTGGRLLADNTTSKFLK